MFAKRTHRHSSDVISIHFFDKIRHQILKFKIRQLTQDQTVYVGKRSFPERKTSIFL